MCVSTPDLGMPVREGILVVTSTPKDFPITAPGTPHYVN